ncbi:MAG: type IV conjugative transfer system coupling protein TraD [Gammaproteobacteria bacterium]|nr:type IV conjugative transfer system coupling protein TraD [Gammaproteobacteria bacterium]
MSDYPVEALLRPPVEYFAAGTYAATAMIAMAAPEVFMMVPSVSYFAGAVLSLRGAVRFRQGWRIRSYQQGLWHLPWYVLSTHQIPGSQSKLFIGKGFRWDERHTQRLADLERSKHRKYRDPAPKVVWARQFEIRHEQSWALRPLISALQWDSTFNPVRPLPPGGGNPALHAVGMLEGEQPVHINQDERNGHTLVLGTTRVGKTRFAEIMIAQDIRRGDVTICFDPKGDPDLFRRMYIEAKKAGRIDQFYFFHLGYPELSARYNPVGNYTRITEVASRIAGQLPGEGQSQAFREFVWRYVNGMAKALNALGQKPSYELIQHYGEDIEPLVVDYLTHYLERENHRDGKWSETIQRYITGFEEKEDGFKRGKLADRSDRSDRALALHKYFRDFEIMDPVAHSLIKTFEYERGYLDKLVGSLLPLMEKLCTGKTAELLSPDYSDRSDPRPIFDWHQIIRSGGIVYIGLDALSDPEVASAVGNSMFADLTSVSSRIYKAGKGRAVNIHADEFNEIIGDEFIPLLNKAGGAGFQVTAYTQTWSDILARMGDKAKAGQVQGNFNTIHMLRVRELETAEMLTKQLKQVEINQLTTISAATDSSEPGNATHFVSRTEQRETSQRVDLIHPQDLIQLPKGHCFSLLSGGTPHKIRLPWADPRDLDDVPDDITKIAAQMRESYNTSDNWYSFSPSFAVSSQSQEGRV